MAQIQENLFSDEKTPIRILNKPTGTVHIANNFTFVERKLINCLIWHAQLDSNQLINSKRTIPVTEVFRNLGLAKSNNTAMLKASLRNLVSTVIEWNIYDQDKTAEWGICTFLSVAKISKGQLNYILNPEVVDQIRQPRLFSQIRLLIQANFKSKYSLILYEFFLDHLCRLKSCALNLDEVPVERLYQLCGVYESYKDGGRYRVFNQKILKKALDEINTKSDLFVETQSVRDRRHIVSLNIHIRRTTKTTIAAISQDESRRLDLFHRLANYAVESRVINSLFCKYDLKHVSNNLEYVIQRSKIDTIDNMASYIVAAIKGNYAGDKNYKIIARKGQVIPINKETPKSDIRERLNAARDFYEGQPVVWRTEELEKFEQSLKENSNSLLISQYKKNGLASSIVAANFYQRFYKNVK